MTGDLVVFGAGGQARETAEVARDRGWRVTAFLDLRGGGDVDGVPVLAEGERPSGVFGAIGVGAPDIRAKIYAQHADALVAWPSLIHRAAVVSPQASISPAAAFV